MTRRPPGTFGVLRLLARNAMLRVFRAAHIMRVARRRQGGGQASRGATPRKGSLAMSMLLIVALPMFLLQSTLFSAMFVHRIVAAATAGTSDTNVTANAPVPERVLLVDAGCAAAGPAREMVVQATAWVSLALALALLCLGIAAGNTDIARADWSITWLLGFPVATHTVVLAKALEYGIVQFLPWLAGFPIYLQAMIAGGHGTASLPLAIACTLGLMLCIGALRILCETVLRLRCSVRRLRNWQGLCGLVSILLLFAMFGLALADRIPGLLVGVLQQPRPWLMWLPFAWPALVLERGGAGLLVAGGSVVAIGAVAVAACTRELRGGTVRSTGNDSVRGAAVARRRAPRGVLGKELLLLARDRHFMMQTLLFPILVLGFQAFIGLRSDDRGLADMLPVAPLVFFVGMMGASAGCFQTLSSEGRALWITWSMPQAIVGQFRRKLWLWCWYSLLLCTVTSALFVTLGGRSPAAAAGDWLFAAAGALASCHICGAIGVLGAKVATDHVQRGVPLRFAYLHMFLVGAFVTGLMSDAVTVRGATLVAFVTLAVAMWQQATARLPFLLDPVDDRPPAVTLLDGSMGVVLLHFVTVIVLLMATKVLGHAPSVETLVFTLSVSGAVVVAACLLLLRFRGLAVGAALGLRTGPAGAVRPLLLGVVVGVALGGLGLLFLHLNEQWRWFDLPREARPQALPLAMRCYAVLGAPLVEEILFRGMVFQPLARAFRPWLAAIWSATLFAVVHPTVSWPPVFLLGLGAAFVFHRTRYLPAAMVAHAAYNLVLVAG